VRRRLEGRDALPLPDCLLLDEVCLHHLLHIYEDGLVPLQVVHKEYVVRSQYLQGLAYRLFLHLTFLASLGEHSLSLRIEWELLSTIIPVKAPVYFFLLHEINLQPCLSYDWVLALV
jgi:hypothetical protein